jgi:hypothetical protein
VAGDGFRRWPAVVATAARGNTARKQNVGQQASWEVCGCLRVLPEQLAGGEHGRRRELGAAAAMAAVRLGVACGGGEEEPL